MSRPIVPGRKAEGPSKRPRLAVLSAGGTIAMSGDTAPGGAAMQLGAADLIGAVPQVAEFAEIEAHEVVAKPSASLTLADIAAIAQAAGEAAMNADGVVITHGSDTLEETAFALALLVQTETPIVLTAAMRKPGQPGADGPANLLAACRVAAAPSARGKGILVVAGDEIHAGTLIRKAHSFQPHAFTSLPFGPIGYVAEARVRLALAPECRPPALTYGGGEPTVPILEAGPGFEPQIVAALSTGAIDGLIMSLPGAGHVAAGAVPELAALARRMPVVFASRAGAGETLRGSYGYPGGEIDLIQRGLIPAGSLDARKARIALQLLLSAKADRAAVRTFFGQF